MGTDPSVLNPEVRPERPPDDLGFERAAIDPREILKECLLRGAAAVVIFHTHPSGDPSHSGEGLQFTRRMAEAAAVVGVELVDHIVLGAAGR